MDFRVPVPPGRKPFPKTLTEINDDPRVSFSKVTNKYILEEENGTEWEFQEKLGRWFELVDEELVAQQQKAYALEGVDESEDVQATLKKRKQDDKGPQDLEFGAKKAKKPKKDQPKLERKNTAVYVTNLPLDITFAEFQEAFSKFGVIAEEISTGKPRIRLYTDKEGKPLGDALVIYHRPESVNLALKFGNDIDFRFGEEGSKGPILVTEADFSYKKQKDGLKQTSMKDKKKIIRKTQKMNNKLADWDDDDPSALPDTSSRWDKVVILKHMFTLEELAEDPTVEFDIKEDIRGECAKLGEVTNVVLFDKEADGVVSVRFSTTEAANACVRSMNGRWFAKVQVEAYIAQGGERFQKTNTKKAAFGESDSDEERRLEAYGNWLEEKDDDE